MPTHANAVVPTMTPHARPPDRNKNPRHMVATLKTGIRRKPTANRASAESGNSEDNKTDSATAATPAPKIAAVIRKQALRKDTLMRFVRVVLSANTKPPCDKYNHKAKNRGAAYNLRC